jgi:hypothetical protein
MFEVDHDVSAFADAAYRGDESNRRIWFDHTPAPLTWAC